MSFKKFLKTYWFIISMLVGIVAGCIVGALWPGATALEPLGTVFINLMLFPWDFALSPLQLPTWAMSAEQVRFWAPPLQPL